MTATNQQEATIPGRGDLIPDLTGTTPNNEPIRTRDFYMRRNLAIVFTGAGPKASEWVAEAGGSREDAWQEAGEILLVVPPGTDARDLPAMVDRDGSLASRFGLDAQDLPAVFVIDRYGTVFAASHGRDAVEDLRPSDIPTWLEFIACRCS